LAGLDFLSCLVYSGNEENRWHRQNNCEWRWLFAALIGRNPIDDAVQLTRPQK
jgi:hypothetical protein